MNEKCPKCGSQLIKRFGKNKITILCSGKGCNYVKD